jgi:hypothetical protein
MRAATNTGLKLAHGCQGRRMLVRAVAFIENKLAVVRAGFGRFFSSLKISSGTRKFGGQ